MADPTDTPPTPPKPPAPRKPATPRKAAAPRKTSRTTAATNSPAAKPGAARKPAAPRVATAKRTAAAKPAKSAKTATARRAPAKKAAARKSSDTGGNKWGLAAIIGGVGAALTAGLLALRGSTPRDDFAEPNKGQKAHQADGSDSSASFQAGIADEGTIPE